MTRQQYLERLNRTYEASMDRLKGMTADIIEEMKVRLTKADGLMASPFELILFIDELNGDKKRLQYLLDKTKDIIGDIEMLKRFEECSDE